MILHRTVKFILNSITPAFKKRYVVVCSDDWGTIRVRSNTDRLDLIKKGISMDTNRFNRFDTLESNDDLDQLLSVLKRHRDCRGHNPVLTLVMNVANPDFESIRRSNYEEYAYRPFTSTLQSYPNSDKVFSLYKQGVKDKLLDIQFHGREHIQVSAWLKALRSNDSKTRLAFEHDFFFLNNEDLSSNQYYNIGEAYNFNSKLDLINHNQIIVSGVNLFNELWGYQPVSFTAPSLMYHDELNETLSHSGIRLLDVPRFRSIPIGNNNYRRKLHYLGQSNQFNQKYITRNAVFESNLENSDVDNCLNQIQQAFTMKQVVIISNHRASFVGGIDERNRTNGLRKLDELFARIIKTWPDVEFIGMRDLSSILYNTNS
jgi:hypothetical protein